ISQGPGRPCAYPPASSFPPLVLPVRPPEKVWRSPQREILFRSSLLLSRRGRKEEPHGDGGSTKHGKRAREEHRTQSGPTCDQPAEQRDLGPAQPVGQVTKDQTGRDQGNREGAKGEPDRTPSALYGEQRTEGDNRAEADAAERRTKSRHPDCADHLHECGPGAALRRNGRQWGDEQHRYERNQRRRDRDDGKATNDIKSGTERRPERKGSEHRHPDPGYDSSCALRTDESQSPADRARDDE